MEIFSGAGTVQLASSAVENDILWNTKRLDEDSGLYLYKYRHYSAKLGRWLSRDPIEEEGGVNVYAMIYNSPNLWSDVSGNAPIRMMEEFNELSKARGGAGGAGEALSRGYLDASKKKLGDEFGTCSAASYTAGAYTFWRNQLLFAQQFGQAERLDAKAQSYKDAVGRCCNPDRGQIVNRAAFWYREEYPSLKACEEAVNPDNRITEILNSLPESYDPLKPPQGGFKGFRGGLPGVVLGEVASRCKKAYAASICRDWVRPKDTTPIT